MYSKSGELSQVTAGPRVNFELDISLQELKMVLTLKNTKMMMSLMKTELSKNVKIL